MILADKIIRLRKKLGWSQEELAEKMNVSRQAVSKWEGAQTVPDLGKVLQLSQLFGVTTDYLLKDEIEIEEFTGDDGEVSVKRVSLQEAGEFMQWRQEAAKRIALATFLCIISPIPLLLLAAASEVPSFGMSDNLAAGVGVITLLLMVALAVVSFVQCGFRNSSYEFLEKEAFETEYGVVGMVKEAQQTYRPTYAKYNTIATFICVLSPVPLLIGAFTENGLLTVIMLCFTILLVGVGVMLFITAGVRWASIQKLLKEGDYSEDGKKRSKRNEVVSSVYWLSATAVYLGWSFLTNDWHMTWLVWPIAGVLFAGVMAICNLFADRSSEK
ncbi:MAG: helix-turn-helix transcriptional regulator [Oscillospiraceae bacterium]|nr:helix-turn-helix transcriptional regulator [Oscillospiraceae bacterium]